MMVRILPGMVTSKEYRYIKNMTIKGDGVAMNQANFRSIIFSFPALWMLSFGPLELFGFGTALAVHNFVGLSWLSLQAVARVHTAGAFAILSFLVVHVYMTTTGHTIFAHIRAMITGWEQVADEQSVGDWEHRSQN
jgi:hypothetical protein